MSKVSGESERPIAVRGAKTMSGVYREVCAREAALSASSAFAGRHG
jgi:hypothetical protein